MEGETKKPVVLVIEDEKPLLEIIKKRLGLAGFDVMTCRTAMQGLDYLTERGTVDVIWLDHYLLGKEDGFDFVVKIKSDKNWKNIPVFVVSNTATSQKKHAYIKLGVSKFYTKADYKLEQIVDDIKEFLKVN